LTDYLVGTGGWAYFDAPGRSHLKAYSEVFNFVEVNSTFYEYPDAKTVEGWRRTVPENFVFAVRCHQDLTHRIGLKPVDEAYAVFGQALAYCGILEAPFLVLETPSRYVMDQENVEWARNFLSSLNLRGVRLVWEIRALITPEAIDLMRDLNIVQSVDLSREEPSFHSDAIYSRLFGKGKHNIYQFTDEELVEIDRKIAGGKTRIAALSFHGIRMNADAARFMQYKKTGKFIPVTPYAGIESAKAVLSEDARFPASKKGLIEQQGWKVVDLTPDKRVHLSEVLVNLPEKTYRDLNEVVKALGARN
jgi:uncharacterized protein YecE (DUF72 family)